MSWALFRHSPPYAGSVSPGGWFFAPQTGPTLDMRALTRGDVHRDLIERYGDDVEPLQGDPDEHAATQLTVRAYAADDGTEYVMSLSAASVRRMLTPQMRADLIELLAADDG